MAAQQPVCPQYGSGATVTTGASSNVTVPPTTNLILTNLGSNVCYIRVGATTQTATAADYPVPPGSQVTITKDASHLNMAHYGALASTLHYMGGEGY